MLNDNESESVTSKETKSQSESKRLKFDLKSEECWKYLENDEEPDFLEQMGIGMLDPDDSSSRSSFVSNPSSNLMLNSNESVDLRNFCQTVFRDIESENDTENVDCYFDAEATNTKTPNVTLSGKHLNKPSHIDIFTDSEDTPQPVCHQKFSNRVMSSHHHKGRSPLTIVSNNNLCAPQQQQQPLQTNSTSGDTSIKQFLNIINEEKFFLYRKRQSKQFYGEDVFGKLSDEIILHIFKWLPKKALIRCSHVSTRFNRVAQDETLWTRLDLSGRCLRSGALGKVITRGVVIMRLAQTEIAEPIFDEHMECPYRSKLQFLDLSMCVISTSSLQQLLSKCWNLKKLSLENVPLNAIVCHEIATNNNLEALNLTMCDGIDAYSVMHMMRNLKKLHSLNISWTSLSLHGIDAFVKNVTPNLLRLNIAGCRKSMTDMYLLELVKRCPQLLELDLSDCTQLSSDTIRIVCKLNQLEYLSLSRCYSINVSAYLNLTDLTSLLFLDVFGLLSEQALAMLQNTFPAIGVNKFMHSSVARPTVGSRRTSIWGLRTRD